ncbi:MAG: sugar ABC transporter substrate-binding protein [Chloroflexota bacterium]|nr:sugar ABC transporter substrate-binding protein [Chloroflexota bacterium]
MSKKLSRRDFLRIAATSGTAASVALIGLRPIAAQADAAQFSLAMVDWSDPVQTAFEETIIPRFVEENPGASVTVNWTNWGRYNEEMTTAFASGVTPDVFQGGAVWAPQMARRNWAVALNDFINADEEWDWGDFPAGLQADVTIRGDIVAVPYRQDLRTLWYNKEMLADAGFDAPPTDWDEFLAVAQATTVRDGDAFDVEGYHYSDASGNWQRDWQPFLMWVHMADGQFLSDDLTTCALDQAGALEALEFLVALVQEHEVTAYPGLDPQGDLNVLAGRNAAMQLSSANMERDVNLYAPDEKETIYPTLPLTGNAQATHSWVNKFFVSSQTADEAASWGLLRFMTRKDMLEVYSASNNNTPPRLSLLDAEYMSEKHKIILESAVYARTFPQHHNLIALFRPIAAELEQALSGIKAPADALADATSAINEILADE